MKLIDFNNISEHVKLDRQARFEMINSTIGFGSSVVEAPDKKGRDCTAILTDTGVIMILDPSAQIVTAWVASVPQAISVWRRAMGNVKLPAGLNAIVQYNNNTTAWKKMCAAA